MRYLTTLVLVLLTLWPSAPLRAEQSSMPFVGRWRFAGPETCAKDFAGESVAMEITRNQRLLFLENICRVRSIRRLPDDENSYRLRLDCNGDGGRERRDTMLVLLSPSDLHGELLLRIEIKTGGVTAYRKCESL